MTLKFGDVIRAKEGTVDAIFAEGRTGKVVEVVDPDPRFSSCAGTNNLVRWVGDTILMGFHPKDVEVVT